MDRFTPQNDSWPSRFNLVGYLGTLVHIWENGDNSHPFLYPPRPKAIGTGQGWKGREGVSSKVTCSSCARTPTTGRPPCPGSLYDVAAAFFFVSFFLFSDPYCVCVVDPGPACPQRPDAAA